MFDFSKYSHIFETVRPSRNVQRILIVADTGISFNDGDDFGLSTVVRIANGYSRGCIDLSVTTENRPRRRRNDDGTFTHVEYFTDSKLDGVDQLWLFGLESEGTNALSDDEVDVISRWMDNGGGVFATGDHAALGADLCARIPRVRSMRRWTADDGVPPRVGPKRLDTLQPATASDRRGATVIQSDPHERDATPQKISWIAEHTSNVAGVLRRTPHELLCHPVAGVIDVMPDHPHEGRTRDEAEMVDQGLLSAEEFPDGSGGIEAARAIAYGLSELQPGMRKGKFEVDRTRFPMVTIWDGRPARRGRVVVDSTWHHWFDMNIDALEAAGGTNWAKIERYFLNIAIWLSRPGTNWCEIIEALNSYPAIEVVHSNPTRRDLGLALHESLISTLGPCTTADVIDPCAFNPILCKLEEFDDVLPEGPFGPMCLSCPPPGFFEAEALGGAVEQILRTYEEYQIDVPIDQAFANDELGEALERAATLGATEAISEALQAHVDRVRTEADAFERALSGARDVEQQSR